MSPCYNEEEVLEQSAARLTDLFDELVGKEMISADSFVLFVNDGSKDRTWNIIKKLHKENPYVKGMNLARNVGHQSAIMAGIMTAKVWSDAVVSIDADLQDDLNAIEEMIATEGPFLLEACVIEEGNVLPMTPPGGSVNQMLLEC